MNRQERFIWKQLATAILGLLGFASCGKVDNIDNFAAEYGQPHADFKALGTVADETGGPIEGIRVAITRHKRYQSDWYEHDTLFTDDKGAYLLNETIFEGPDDVKIVFDDIDGEENGGSFESVESTPAVTQTKKGDGNWYDGAFVVEANIMMKKRQ